MTPRQSFGTIVANHGATVLRACSTDGARRSAAGGIATLRKTYSGTASGKGSTR